MMTSPLVFLIDDDIDDQDIFNIAVTRTDQSAKCVFANDGIQALEKISGDKNFIPDFIFIDMNMPRMNGKQCLSEIKKIDRLKHVPVFMYSTSADDQTIKENINLGATDFIVKPSDIKTLSHILSEIFQKKFMLILFAMLFVLSVPKNMRAQSNDSIPAVKELKKLSVEQLMDLVVTSVSKSPEKLSEVASAVQVITSNDIERSSATRLPESLRLATNMQISQSGSHDWGITARGFNGLPVASSSLANKLLVMIDGRSVYTPLFGGVFWDVQNVYLPDLDRIEVVSGPGGSLWGPNAVNGIVNIISKDASKTQGIHASVSAGTFLNDHEGVRYGFQADSTVYFRVYGQHFKYNSTTLAGDIDALDSWYIYQEGFRMDYLPLGKKDRITFQGDFYQGETDDTGSTHINGQNLLYRFTHDISQTSSVTAQLYYDRTYRDITRQGFIDEMNTYDIDVQHDFKMGKVHRIVWGLGYRLTDDNIKSILNDWDPAQRNLELTDGFFQDQIGIIPEKLELTIGTKVFYNDYTFWEFHPTARLAWTPNLKYTIWAAVSHAVRTPSRFDRDNKGDVLGSYGNFDSEKVNAYELGLRYQHENQYSFSASVFYNNYFSLRSVDTNVTPPPDFYFANNLKANTYGFEFSGSFNASEWWRIRAGYTFLKEEFNINSPKTFPQTYLIEALDPENQFSLQSIMNVGKYFQVDATMRYVDDLPEAIDKSKVPAYSTADLRIAYQYKWITIAAIGKNLFEENHLEFGTHQIPRRYMGKITVVF
jgi:iron complex outermembrane receptor protein